ncbi:hypothetical protein I317_07293 [Kwoniella heveanensis CBS 569]|nr:hypothetical protein I317_07293 [Kwoniella heveanensis CBS 569]
MSYFSDSSSTCTAPPLTPSPYHHQHHHASSSSSSSHSFSSPTPYTPNSPPDPLKQYSSALKMKMSAGLTAAMRDLKDDRGGPERKFDAEYGYDEDPIDRHVRLFLTPRKVPERSRAVPELGLGMRPMVLNEPATAPPADRARTIVSAIKHGGSANQASLGSTLAPARERLAPSTAPRASVTVPSSTKPKERTISDADAGSAREIQMEVGMLAPAPPSETEYEILDEDPVPAKFRPGLIHFHRSNSSSLDPPRPPYSRMSSDVSTGSSLMSEASFEAVRAEDIVSMYGGFGSGTTPSSKASDGMEDPFGLELEEHLGRASMDSTDTYSTIRASTHNSSARPGIPTQAQALKVYPQPAPQTNTYAAHPTQQQQQQYHAQSQPHFPSRPSFTRKRSRVHPYEPAPLATLNPNPNVNSELIGMGGNPSGNSRRTPGSSGGLTPDDFASSGETEPAWLSNRTVSEQMVAMAGLRCQRQRAGVTRGGAR